MNGVVWVQRTFLTSEKASPCGRYSLPMNGCNGPSALLWMRTPFGVSILIGIRPLLSGDAA